MALRAFHSNPALGGFGGESNASAYSSSIASEENCDAFAQVLKELVDNAVDACGKPGATAVAKRVRVVIERVQHNQGDHEEYTDTPSLLRVTVSDNGCGMDDIQQCVDCFRSTKGTNAETGARVVDKEHDEDEDEDDSEQEMAAKDRQSKEAQTAGRYGLGLTLCLLHAQRLVPGSCASITSATAQHENYTRANFVVDKDQDSVRCVKRERLAKTSRDESGTAVSLLLPDGPMAKMAWPRIAEYFARFQLSLQLQCSVEVLAPSLSPVPLFVRPPSEQQQRQQETGEEEEKQEEDDVQSEESLQDDLFWMHGAVDQPSDNSKSNIRSKTTSSSPELTKHLALRKQIRGTVQSYLKRNVELQNIAHVSHPIGRRKRRGQGATPTMDVTMVVHSREQDDDDSSRTTSSSQGDDTRRRDMNSDDISVHNNHDRHARLSLVRMVNSVPLLDGAEAAACGLVLGVSSNQTVWNSFGLQIASTSETISQKSSTRANNHDDDEDDDQDSPIIQAPVRLFVPVYSVRDSDQVAPFFQRGVHDLFEDDGSEEVEDTEDDESIDSEGNPNRKSRARLLPAHIRLGEILVIVQINAEPSSLPLPTLSKGRLPLNNGPISTALELCITDCLRSLQSTNSELLLTSQQLKHTVRDTRYIPAVSAAIASIVSNSDNAALRSSFLRSVESWKRDGGGARDVLLEDIEETNASDDDSDSPSSSESGRQITVSAYAPAIEKRLRSVLHSKTNANASRRSKENHYNAEEGSHEAECDGDEEENALWHVDEESQDDNNRGLPTNVSEEVESDTHESDDESALLSTSGQDDRQDAGSSSSLSSSGDSHPASDCQSRGDSAQEPDEDEDDEWW